MVRRRIQLNAVQTLAVGFAALIMLGGVLLGVGIVLPLGWLLSFYLSLRAEVKKRKLAQAPAAYTLRLTDRGLGVSNGTEQADFPWSQLHQVCRLHRCVCL